MVHAFAHADKSKAGSFRIRQRNPSALISLLQPESHLILRNANRCRLRAAMLHNVVHRLLDNAEHAQRYGRRHVWSDSGLFKRDIEIVLAGNLTTPSSRSGHESDRFQYRRMQFVRQIVDMPADLTRSCRDGMHTDG